MARYYVNVYLHDQAYGGREEGGWWYDTYEPAAATVVGDDLDHFDWVDAPLTYSCADRHSAKFLKQLLEKWCGDENRHRKSDISSIASEGRYEVEIERNLPRYKPERKPHYE